MLAAQKYLNVVNSRGQRDLKLTRVYRGLRKPELFLMAYMNLYANQGAMTPGIDPSDTIDGMSMKRINDIIHQLEEGSFEWKPARRVSIQKPNGGQRLLGIPGWTDKLVQEAIRLILMAYYEPRFSHRSHGFRPNKGCHTALEEIVKGWRGVKWFIEADIKGCFDNINHDVLLTIISRDIHDARLLNLLREMLKAGYLENWQYRQTYSGIPQGGVLSPLLANIYLNELDQFIEGHLVLEWTRGTQRRPNPEYQRLKNRVEYLRAKERLTEDELRELNEKEKRRRTLPSGDPYDPNYRRLRYVRYADDFLLGFIGPRSEAEAIKEQISQFLEQHLRLKMSTEKTLITHATTQRARFLGYEVHVAMANSKRCHGRRSINSQPMLTVPKDVIEAWDRRHKQRGKTVHRPILLNHSDYDIVRTYEQELTGVIDYYSKAINVNQWNKVRYTFLQSLVKTLAGKHRQSIRWVYRRYSYQPEDGRKGIRVIQERDGYRSLVTTFGTRRIRYDRQAHFTDSVRLPIRYNKRAELAQRLQSAACELCGSAYQSLEVHHIRKLSALNRYGKEVPHWVQRMSAIRRKTLVVCRSCHESIHAGRYDGEKIRGH